MANRYTLHVSKLDDFKEWLNSEGIPYRPGKGNYQVLQVRTEKDGWQCIFKRDDMPEHYSVNDKLMRLVWIYLTVRKRG